MQSSSSDALATTATVPSDCSISQSRPHTKAQSHSIQKQKIHSSMLMLGIIHDAYANPTIPSEPNAEPCPPFPHVSWYHALKITQTPFQTATASAGLPTTTPDPESDSVLGGGCFSTSPQLCSHSSLSRIMSRLHHHTEMPPHTAHQMNGTAQHIPYATVAGTW